jgi:uncharacterized protein
MNEPRRSIQGFWGRANQVGKTTLVNKLWKEINKPALTRKLFELGCTYSGQILTFTKMLGQLHDAGKATTLHHPTHVISVAFSFLFLNFYILRSNENSSR